MCTGRLSTYRIKNVKLNSYFLVCKKVHIFTKVSTWLHKETPPHTWNVAHVQTKVLCGFFFKNEIKLPGLQMLNDWYIFHLNANLTFCSNGMTSTFSQIFQTVSFWNMREGWGGDKIHLDLLGIILSKITLMHFLLSIHSSFLNIDFWKDNEVCCTPPKLNRLSKRDNSLPVYP